MSFNQMKFDRSFNQTRGIFDKFVYKTNDSIATVSADGYFKDVRFSDEEINGGIIEAECSDGFIIIRALSRNTYEVVFTASNTFNGFIDYNDAGTSTTPITLAGGVWTTVTNDGLGAFTNKNYPPAGVAELMDTSTGAFDPTELSFGDTMLIRNDFTITPSTNNTLLELRYQLGAGAGAYTLEKIINRLDSGSGIPYRFSLEPDLIYMGDSNTRDNPIVLQVKLSGNGTLVNAGSAISVVVR